MRPSSPVHATGAGLQKWNSPIPYLFGGLALMLGLIAVALLILACSYSRSSSSSSSSSNSSSNDHGEDEKPGKSVYVLKPEMEPKIVVIMAGDENPRYLAMPLSAARPIEEV